MCLKMISGSTKNGRMTLLGSEVDKPSKKL